MSSIAVVKSIVGQVFALSPDGVRRLLIEGDRLFAGDQVMTGPEGMISLELSDGRTLDLGRDSQWTAVDDAQPAVAAANTELSVSELQQAISLGLDPTAELEATAAGGGGAGGGGGAAGGGHSFVVLDATAEQIDPTVGYPTAGLGFAASGAEEQLGLADSNTPAADNAPIDINTPPVALPAVISTDENAVLNDKVPPATDIDGTIVPNGYALVSGPGANNGSLIFNADGSYSFTPGTDFDALADGESRDVTFTYTATDNDGAVSTPATITITVTGSNDAPTTNDVAVAGDEDATIAIALSGADVDGTLNSFVITSLPANGTLYLDAAGTQPISAGTSVNTSTVYFKPTANWSGDTGFLYAALDSGGATDASPATASIRVNPISDTPTLAASAVSGNEDSPIALNIASALTDTDGSETLSIRLDNIPVGAVLSNTAGDILTISGGSIVLTPDQLAGLAITPPANSHVDFNLSVTATAVDGSAAPASTATSLAVTVNPVNDAPVAVANTVRVGEDDDDQAGYNDNSASTTIIGGNVLSNDVDIDLGDSITVTGVAAGTPISASGSVSSSVMGTYGSVKINADGSYTYTLDNSKPEVQALAFKQHVTDTFTYTITDSEGATSSTTLTVYVNGKNDAPVVTINGTDSASASLAETNSGLTTAGTLSIFDVDTSDKVTVSKAPAFSVDGSYAGPRPSDTLLKAMLTVSGGEPSTTQQGNPHGINWSFNSGSEAFNFIPAGQTLVLHYTVRAKDSNTGTGNFVDQPVTITITGSNDAAVIAGTTSGAVIEDNPSNTVSGTLTAIDVDNSNNVFQAISTPTASQNGYGTFTITAGGVWTYSLDNSNPVVNALNNTGSLSDTFTVRAEDGTEQTITVAISGTNDAPVTTPVALNAITEDSGARLITQAELLANASDVDNPSLTASNLTIASGNGSLINNGDGTWSYTPAANDDSGVTFNYSVTDGSLSANGSASLDLTPVNDASAPTLTLATKGQWTFNEAQGSSTTLNGTTGQSGTLNDSDNAGGSQLPSFITNSRNNTSGNNISFNDNGDRVDLTPDSTQSLLGTSSLAFWVNTTQLGGANGAGNSWNLPTVLGSEHSGGGNDIQWGAINNTGKIGFGIGNVGGVYSTTTVSDGNWHHVTITRDAGSKLVQIYVDGNLEAQGNPNDAAFTGTLNRLTSLGANNNFANDASASDLTDNRYFQGKLDDLRIYSQVLTAAQVAAIRSVESGFHDTAIANDGSVMSLALTPGNYTSLAVTGLVAGMVISDGNGHSQTATNPDQSIDLTGWTLGNLQLSNAGTASTTLAFTATNTVHGDSASTQQYLTIANGTSQLSQLGSGNDSVTGTAEADLLRGDNGADTLNGGAGADRLEGGNGIDTLNGDAGNDILIGDASNDILFGGVDNDILNGGSGSDSLRGGLGNDILTGGSSADTFVWKTGDLGKDVVTDFNPSEGDRIDLRDLLQGETDATMSNFLQIDTTSNSLLISSTGQLNVAGGTVASHADTTIKLDGFDLSSASINTLIAGADPTIKVDHS